MNNKICIMGLGYVGLALAYASSEKYEVVNLDIKSILDNADGRL